MTFQRLQSVGLFAMLAVASSRLLAQDQLSPSKSNLIDFEPSFEIPFAGPELPLTLLRDVEGRPFLYVASKEAGLRVFDVRREPKLVGATSIDELQSMHVMSVQQSRNRLFLALGNHWDKRATPGLAVVDVARPGEPMLLGLWKDSVASHGAAAVSVQGATAYLAAMQAGLIVLDIQNPREIRELARMLPDPNFPEARGDRAKINARGLALDGRRLYLCNDAGGLRVIDVSDPRKPVEIGRYSNPALQGRPRAYNNVVVRGARVYAAVDYVGLEILDVSNPKSIRLVGWWNPWNPRLEPLRWFNCPGHANELAYDAASKTILIAAGRTDLAAVDVSDPARPRQVGQIGRVDDAQATWGLSVRGDFVDLSYIRAIGIPFRADWAGIKSYRILRGARSR